MVVHEHMCVCSRTSECPSGFLTCVVSPMIVSLESHSRDTVVSLLNLCLICFEFIYKVDFIFVI